MPRDAGLYHRTFLHDPGLLQTMIGLGTWLEICGAAGLVETVLDDLDTPRTAVILPVLTLPGLNGISFLKLRASIGALSR